MDLFPKNKVVGVFRGFQQGGLEFYADLVLPYRSEFQNSPMHGQFLLVQLANPNEAVLGRIVAFSAGGKLAQGEGEEFNVRAMLEGLEVPEDIREQYLRYRVEIRVLGVVRKTSSGIVFAPSHRRLPHVGSKVAFPDDAVLRELAGHNIEGATIGHLAFGEYVYADGNTELEWEPWMQVLTPQVLIRFPVSSLVARRSFVFARAGFGKSNLVKLLFSELYRETPTVEKRGGRKAKVGTVLFDPDGEYFWPDDKGRPGLCDVPHLNDKLVVFTSRKAPSPYYKSFVAGDIRLDIRRFRPADVISIALDPERQEQQNVRKLRSLNYFKWRQLVDLIYRDGNNADLRQISEILGLDYSRQEAEAIAARSNMTAIVRMLHDPRSQTLDLLEHALKAGKLCVVDMSQMRGRQSLILSGLILRRIFDHNQREFTEAEPQTIPTIAVIEEAQSVLGGGSFTYDPFVEWVKEGRKYDLGALLVTQQPGSIPTEILSQGDNWFVFHLLSQADLVALKRVNAHFSDDLLSSLLNEPIPGQGVFWSSVGGKPYPVSLRVLSFERKYRLQDPHNTKEAISTAATELLEYVRKASEDSEKVDLSSDLEESSDEEPLDEASLIQSVASWVKENLEKELSGPKGMRYGTIMGEVVKRMPSNWTDKKGAENWAYHNLPAILDAAFGKDCWKTRKEFSERSGKDITWVYLQKAE